jgi:hypothetical protein
MRSSFGRTLICAIAAVGLLRVAGVAQQPVQTPVAASSRLYNTAKQKLLEGKQVFSFTQSKPDVASYCEYAKHYDFAWFEMQHSTL